MIPDEKVKLTSMSPAAGCAAKIGPGTLVGILQGLPGFEDPNINPCTSFWAIRSFFLCSAS